jgi:hypothetical protein
MRAVYTKPILEKVRKLYAESQEVDAGIDCVYLTEQEFTLLVSQNPEILSNYSFNCYYPRQVIIEGMWILEETA